MGSNLPCLGGGPFHTTDVEEKGLDGRHGVDIRRQGTFGFEYLVDGFEQGRTLRGPWMGRCELR